MRMRKRSLGGSTGLLFVLLVGAGCRAPRPAEPGPEVDPLSDPPPLLASCARFQHGDGYRVRLTFLDIDHENRTWGPDGEYLVELLRGDEVRARWRTHAWNPFAEYADVLYRAEYTPGMPIGALEDWVIAFDLEAGRELWRVPIPVSGPFPNGWSFYSVRVALNPAHPRGVYVETRDHNGRTGWFLDRASGAVVSGPKRVRR